MKIRLTGFAFIATAQLLCAQTQQGNGIISGTAGVSYSRINPKFGTGQYSWQPTLNLTAGRFMANNWLAGLSVSGNMNESRSTPFILNGQAVTIARENQITQVSVTTTPFVRRYFAVGPVYAFVGAGLSVGITGSHQRGYEPGSTANRPTDTRTTGWLVNPYIDAGINYFVSNRLAVQVATSASSVPFNAGNLGLGLVYWTGPNQTSGPVIAQENSQTTAGNWLVEGSFSVIGNSTNSLINSSKQSAYQLSPSVGYFVGKNTLLGLSLPLAYDQSGSSDRVNWSVGISPYYQRYWLAARLTPYTRASVTYTLRALQSLDNNRIETLGADLSAGLAYMAGKRFILETGLASLSLSRTQLDLNRNLPGITVNTIAQWNASVSAGLRGNFAVRYVLTRPR